MGAIKGRQVIDNGEMVTFKRAICHNKANASTYYMTCSREMYDAIDYKSHTTYFGAPSILLYILYIYIFFFG